MTDEEILATADACGMMLFGLGLDKAKFEFCILAFAKQIAKLERHHEREALAQTQEPVALQYPQKDIDWQREQQIKAQASTPPQRTWVGLTRMDLIKCGVLPFGMSYELCQAIEAKLKEKNT